MAKWKVDRDFANVAWVSKTTDGPKWGFQTMLEADHLAAHLNKLEKKIRSQRARVVIDLRESPGRSTDARDYRDPSV